MKQSYTKMFVILAILIAYLPLSYLLGQSDFMWGGRIYQTNLTWLLVSRFLMLFVFLHVFILSPITTAMERKRGLPQWLPYFLFTWAIVTLPLLGLVYFLGDVKTSNDYLELLITVMPVSFGASLLFFSTGVLWLASTFATLGIFIPVFVANDLLAPFPVLLNFVSKGPIFYYLRWFSAVSAVILSLTLISRRIPQPEHP